MTPAGATARAKYRYVPAGLMLFFGLAFAVVAAGGFETVQRNPELTTLACDAAAAQDIGSNRWVKLPTCEIAFDEIFVISKGSRVDAVWLPLVPPGSGAAADTVTLLVSEDPRVIELTGELERASDDAAVLGVLEELTPLVVGDGTTGLTTTVRRDDRVLVERNFPKVDSRYLVIEHGGHPDRNQAMVSAVVAAVLLLAAGGYALFARKQTRADAEAVARWQQEQAAAQAQYQAQYYDPGQQQAAPQSHDQPTHPSGG